MSRILLVDDDEMVLRARVGIVFLAVFAAFRTNPSYQIKGIDRHGVRAVTREG